MSRLISLRFKLTIINMLILVICGGLAALFLFNNEIENSWRTMGESVYAFATLSTYQIVENYKSYYGTDFAEYSSIITKLLELNEYSPSVQLMNLEGIILFDSEEIIRGRYEGSERKTNPENIQKIENKNNNPETINLNGNEFVEIIQPYVGQDGSHEFSVKYSFSTKKVREKIQNVLWTISTSLSVGVMIIFIIFTVLFSRILITPINKLSENVKLFAKGKTRFSRIKSNDEIGELSNAFDDMTQEIISSRKEIEDHNKNLERKVAEKTRELREMDVKKNEFIAIAYREIKRPLTLIHGFAQLLQNRQTLENKNKRKEYLKIMEKETGRLSKIISNMLDLSRMDLEITKPEIESVNPGKILDAVKERIMYSKWGGKLILFDLESYSPKTGEKPVHVIFDAESDLPKIRSDKNKLVQILENLAENAINNTEKGFVKISVKRQDSNLLFSVEDSGAGIPKKDHDKIFSRFFQSRETSAGGGLGLAVCKEFVTLLGGNIGFESAEGRGSTFYFTIPIRK